MSRRRIPCFDEPPTLSRRDFLQGSGALLGSCLLAPAGMAWAASPILALDFRGSIPSGVSYRRASPASLADGAQLRTLPPNTPRFPLRQGKPLGLLIEGAASNLIANAARPDRPGWSAGGGVIVAAGTDLAPDGSGGAYRIVRPEPKSGSQCEVTVSNAPSGDFAAASVWLRSTAGSGKWRLRLLDFTTYNNVSAVVEVGPEWRRYSLALNLQARDIGAKRFAVLWNEPIAAATAAPAIYALKPATPYLSWRTPLTLGSVLMWGAQYEVGNEASSFIATTGSAGQRAADEVTIPAAPLNASAGRLTIVLPNGGRRGGVILDAHGDGGGLRLAYSNSGWIVAQVGRVVLAGFGDVTADPVIRLEWSAAGVQLFTGATPESLTLQAAVKTNPLPLACGSLARLGMLADGQRPLGRVLAQLTLSGEVATVAQAVRPNFTPAPYRLVFGDDFDDPDLTRINENATGGRPGAPAWRSRYRHERRTAINQEKQIYMDPQFAGTARQPLRVQPFAIRDGILQIRAERADPVAVSPFVWNRAYTSGCITSELTHWQTYGYFEMRARLPRGKGFWPAFWLLPKRATWPPEVDVFEASGTRPYAIKHGVIEKPRSATTPGGMWIEQIIDISDGFHIYGMEWSRDNIVYFIDGKKSFEYGPHGIHEDMYLLANLALGSHDPNWIPDPDPTTPFPGMYEIDYIRAYQRGAS
ncbi:glycoside hydrolase family 16 protein [Ferribacterium limneticum]|uniref:glycoside hydrolase family 16 protein n=1 Tax=Ferribacterium limneticum TaxID=76259 RepID=UPI001CF83748|nr:glycoside hydrolase family 16 protein [Ferribacterium limneticum]UCV24547.1 glycoside hydrolase family 16 protein [Ferribacterium limneticum]